MIKPILGQAVCAMDFRCSNISTFGNVTIGKMAKVLKTAYAYLCPDFDFVIFWSAWKQSDVK